MDTPFYLSQFQQAAERLEKNLLHQKQLQVQTGVWLNSVVLRLQKPHWANNPDAKPQTGSAIFFSIWISEEDIKPQALFYNIHALKLRQLQGYSLTSRKFAEDFREQFQNYAHEWPNVSVKFGPQTLMEGWESIDEGAMVDDIFKLANKFIDIEGLIETLLR